VALQQEDGMQDKGHSAEQIVKRLRTAEGVPSPEKLTPLNLPDTASAR
jgi:hypothetical protein